MTGWTQLDFRGTSREATRDCVAPPLLPYIATKHLRSDESRIFDARQAAKAVGIAYRTVRNELTQMKERGTIRDFRYVGDEDYQVWLTAEGERRAKEAA